MLTLHPITSGIRGGRHQDYPTPGLALYEAKDEAAAEEIACTTLMKYHSVSFLRLVDEAGAEVRVYRRGDFFQSRAPLWHVHERIVDRRMAEILDESAEAARLAAAGK
jgi:hypothetical protein